MDLEINGEGGSYLFSFDTKEDRDAAYTYIAEQWETGFIMSKNLIINLKYIYTVNKVN